MSTSKGGGGRIISPREMFEANAEYNRLNQYTPYGSVEYSGPNNNIVTQTMSPEMLALMNQQLGMRGGAMANLMSQYGWGPMDLQNPSSGGGGGGTGGGGAPAGGGDPYANIIAGLPEFGQNLPDLYAGQYETNPNLDLGSLNQVDYNLNLGSLYPAEYGLDLGSLQQVPGEGDLGALRGNIENALFERSRNLLDPVYNEQQQRLEETYANRGMPVGTEERTDQFDLFNQSRERAYQQAANEAVIGGGQEMSRQIADSLGIRQDQLSGLLANANLGLAGRGQGLQELLSSANLGMQGRQQTLSERLAQLGATSGLNQQLFQQALGGRGQLFGEQMGGRQQLFNELMGTTGASFGQLASILGLAPAGGAGGDLGQFYGPGQVDVSGIAGIYQGGQNAAHATDTSFWSNIIGSVLGMAGGGGGGGGGWWGPG